MSNYANEKTIIAFMKKEQFNGYHPDYTVETIAKETALPESAVKASLKELVENNLVKKTRDSWDNRKYLYRAASLCVSWHVSLKSGCSGSGGVNMETAEGVERLKKQMTWAAQCGGEFSAEPRLE